MGPYGRAEARPFQSVELFRGSLSRRGAWWYRRPYPLRHGQRGHQESGSQEERRSGGMDWRSRAERLRKDVGEEDGADDSGESAQALDRALQLPLLGRLHLARHDALRGRPRDGHQVQHGNAPQQQDAGTRQPEHTVADGAANQTEGESVAFANALDHRLHQARAVHPGEDGYHRQRQTDGAVRPAKAVVGIEHVDVLQRLLRQVAEDEHGGEAEQDAVLPDEAERAERVRALPGEGAAMLAA